MIDRANPIDLNEVKIDPSCALRVPPSLALRRQVLPFASLNGQVYVACANPDDAEAVQAVERYTGQRAVVTRAESSALQDALRRVYGDAPARPGTGSVRISGAHRALVEARPVAPESDPDGAVSLADELMRAALLRQASDIHVDPTRSGVIVRLRVDGMLEEYRRLPTAMHTALCSRIKVLAGMDIAERRAPQDGAFTHKYGGVDSGQAVDVRVASLPTKYGERLTLRLLATHSSRMTLESLGMREEDLGIVQRVLDQPHGLMLLTGPTGSGKTTTLYAALLRLLIDGHLNVITIEDPIEYEIHGAAQVEVGAGDKVNFSKSLRSVLRHDPDVLMIGEIRDLETLDVAVKASLTGHLVLSTLHTNSAVSTVTRMKDMGLPPYLIGATLRLSVAQRLVRRLCRHCRKPRALTDAEARLLGRPGEVGREVFDSSGCMYCAGRGFVGRLGLFECLPISADMASRISRGCHESELLAATAGTGFHTLVNDASDKVLSGQTTIKEVMEVVS